MTSPDLAHARWCKSTRSNNSVACVEVAQLDNGRAVRDSKNPDGPRLSFTRQEWASTAMPAAGPTATTE
jgi:Domain of unknown function (DUF397)